MSENRWRAAHDRLRERCEELASNLNRGRELLLDRAAGNDELLERLSSESLRLRESGYGVLPQIKEDAPLSALEPQQQLYSLESLTTDFASEFRDATLLVTNAADGGIALEELVEEHERIRDRLRNLESHLGYHRYWQRAVLENPLPFAARNKVIVQVRALESQLRGGGDAAAIAANRGALVEGLAPFRPTGGLELAERDDGWRVLPVTVTTDIDDERFLAAFRQGVEAAFVHAEEVRALRFRIDLTIRRIPPAELYPDGPPAPGDPIDTQAHRVRFPKGALVLTTGAASTHAWTGRWITLGPEEVSRRTLAHEFAHLLGFDDAYLRGFDGKLDDRFGVVLVEWTGLRDDLMGNVRGGRVTRGMVETLVEAYGPR